MILNISVSTAVGFAVTPAIPEIVVAVSPTIFPFATILPAKVETPVTFN